MSSLENANGRAAPQSTKVSVGAESARCPYCGSPITTVEFREIHDRIEAEEKARLARLKDRLVKEAAAQIEKIKSELMAREAAIRKAAIETATAVLASKLAEAEKAKKAVETQVRDVRANQEAVMTQRLAGQRETLAKQMAEAVNAEKVKAFEEKARLTEQLAEMQRRLEKKPAHELGEPAEVDLYKTLETALPEDRVWRVAKGQKGPDVVIAIVHRGVEIGKIIVDAKNHMRWANAFTAKLRADQLAENADFAILSTTSFPKGARQLLVQDHVIVADPARVVVLVELLRRQIVQNHVLKLSNEARHEKADKLYAYIVSPACSDVFGQLTKVTHDLIDLDTKEADAHHGIWRRRSELIGTVQRLNSELTESVEQIVGGAVASPGPRIATQ